MPSIRRGSASILIALLLLASADLAAQARSYEGRMRVDGRVRTYVVDLPPRYDGRSALPLVLVFHGGGGNGRQVRQSTGFSELARREGFIAVYPDGSGRTGRLLTWNTGTCCGHARDAEIDDTRFVRMLLDTLQATLRVDPARVFAAGHSNGGMMAYQAACALGGRIAAIGVVAGELTVADCRPPRPVSVVHVHGTADENVPFGGGTGSRSRERCRSPPVSHAIDTWRRIDGCPATPTVSRDGAVTHTRYGPCAAGTRVELFAIEGGGHAWPGADPPRRRRRGDTPSTALDATQVIWRFFAAHR